MTYKRLFTKLLSKEGNVTYLEFKFKRIQYEHYVDVYYRIDDGEMQTKTIRKKTAQRLKNTL